MTSSTDRQTFRETVALVAEKARAKLPQAVNGRIESAVKLVLVQDITPQEDGSILVGSSTDPLKTYRLVGTTCECQDFTRGQAPEGWCQHRLAAGIQKRVRELLAAPVPVEPEALPEPWPDNDPEPVPESEAPASPAVPLPEAPASVNVRVQIAGREVQLTLRDADEGRLLARLQAVLAQYPVPQQHNAAAMHKQVVDFCPIHQVQMKENHKENRTWYSHYDEAAGRWCKGK